MNRPDDNTLNANALAVAYRLLGNRPAALAVAGIATQMAHDSGAIDKSDWLAELTELTVAQAVGPSGLGVAPPETDPSSRTRSAIRRRLASASRDERVAGALVHLSGYAPTFVAAVMGIEVSDVNRLASVIAPPPGENYRHLGDPERVGSTSGSAATEPSRRRRPHWTTIAVVVAVTAVVLLATQISGPRPTLGPVETSIPEPITIESSVPDTSPTTQPNTTIAGSPPVSVSPGTGPPGTGSSGTEPPGASGP